MADSESYYIEINFVLPVTPRYTLTEEPPLLLLSVFRLLRSRCTLPPIILE